MVLLLCFLCCHFVSILPNFSARNGLVKVHLGAVLAEAVAKARVSAEVEAGVSLGFIYSKSHHMMEVILFFLGLRGFCFLYVLNR